jgi:hypothetical protein
MQSPNIELLAAALSAAQGEFPAILKDKTATIPGKDGKTGFNYHYADLATIIEATRPALVKNGLAVSQPTVVDNGALRLVTKLLHTSGQYTSSVLPLKLFENPRDMGSALTYARRYQLSAILNIATEEDDDGKPGKKALSLNREQVTRLWEAAKLKGFDQAGFLEVFKTATGVDSPAKAPAESYRKVMTAIEQATR